MWIFVLVGAMALEASDGESRPIVPGDAILLEDTPGKGHRSRATGDADAVLALVQRVAAAQRPCRAKDARGAQWSGRCERGNAATGGRRA